jgi:hypothetical protein
MHRTDDGKVLVWASFVDQHDNLVDKHNALVREWNKMVPKYNAAPGSGHETRCPGELRNPSRRARRCSGPGRAPIVGKEAALCASAAMLWWRFCRLDLYQSAAASPRSIPGCINPSARPFSHCSSSSLVRDVKGAPGWRQSGNMFPLCDALITPDGHQHTRRAFVKRQIRLHHRDKLAVVEAFWPVAASRQRRSIECVGTGAGNARTCQGSSAPCPAGSA